MLLMAMEFLTFHNQFVANLPADDQNNYLVSLAKNKGKKQRVRASFSRPPFVLNLFAQNKLIRRPVGQGQAADQDDDPEDQPQPILHGLPHLLGPAPALVALFVLGHLLVEVLE